MMIASVAIAWPGPCEIVLLLGILSIPAIILLLMRAGSRRGTPPPPTAAFPVIEPDGPGTYRVAGVDKATRADRTMMVEAESPANAQVKAELDGIVVTAVTKQG